MNSNGRTIFLYTMADKKLNEEYLLYHLAVVFRDVMGIEVCSDTSDMITEKADEYEKVKPAKRLFYNSYASNVCQELISYLKKVTMFELASKDKKTDHDFVLTWGNDDTVRISLSFESLNVNPIIPKKLMKICGLRGNTKIHKAYKPEYAKLEKKALKALEDKEKYSDASEKSLNKHIIDPFTDLVISTLSKKRKCSPKLFQYIFGETDRIIIRARQNSFRIYDFSIGNEEIVSHRIKRSDVTGRFDLTFSNNYKFIMELAPNSVTIGNSLSLKFSITFKNIDKIFCVKKRDMPS
jgi:hypothetical protein